MTATPSVTRTSIASINPYNNEVLREFPTMIDEEVERAVAAAHEAFRGWRDLTPDERAIVVRRAGELMLERRDEFARTVTCEMGKLIGESQGEVDLSADILRYYGEVGPALLVDQPIPVEDGAAVVANRPLGVLLGVMPWNYPLYQVVRFAGPNLVAGNTILLKHASNCPQSALALERLFRDAGAPEGVYTNLFVRGSRVGRIIDNPLVQGVSLTGSDRAGASVAEKAGRNIDKTVLELGGSDPFIVLDGEDFDRTIDAAAVGRLSNMGQSCVSAKRMIVVSDIYYDFVDRLRHRFAALTPGDPMDPATTLGPLSSEQAAENLVSQIQDTVAQGATLVLGGKRIDRPGAFVEATILTDVRPGMRAYHEELFGPAAVVYQVADEDEAVALANDNPYGLGGVVMCRDLVRARRVAERLDTGMVWINHPTSSSPELPFGGIKCSGYGRELGDLGIQEFVNKKLIRTFPTTSAIGFAQG
ncbi:NAD-dependent succinate-semialdehyde dehydrogenase [Planosporangium flavigriseum]|uniref:Succinate-semialdehyde dehydrogenase [NADP(+)] n=1 Tax=Planosporangium flavigriseum TaxID=373681 RepID=A0A8J3LEZ4_9ACTN|nr:NAD-dependent succinate-semialdehyde dehydrogenase [Planosporangium flavigriseum]NJC65242.1 NAD-dependent succinate-semialdehyde dehydrogenase [Planosporangium flavigriseum]GIG71862.1 succinate-semialdehyde dehydrogenase [NADP(+)] [Planosporangium flavigriseum]